MTNFIDVAALRCQQLDRAKAQAKKMSIGARNVLYCVVSKPFPVEALPEPIKALMVAGTQADQFVVVPIPAQAHPDGKTFAVPANAIATYLDGENHD